MQNVEILNMNVSKMCFTIAVAFSFFNMHRLAAAGDGKNTQGPLRDTFIISAHRAGGRVHAPDNSMPNILFAIKHKLTAIEIDLRLTKDDELVLWHDNSMPKSYVWTGKSGKAGIRTLSSEEVKKVRYSAKVGDKLWEDTKVVFADEVVKVAKGKINLHLDAKDVPAKNIIEFIRRHKIQRECMVMRGDIDYLKEIHSAEPDVCLEYTDNTLGRRKVDGKWQWYPTEKQHEIYHELMKKLKAAGIDALCTKGLTEEKVAICHEYGLMVRTSAGHMKPGSAPDAFIKMGVDYALTDDPLLIKESVKKLRPGAVLSKPGQTLFELIREGK